jgi:hypothetical protein
MTTKPRHICLGYDSREQAAYSVARNSTDKFKPDNFVQPIHPLVLGDLIKQGLYTRPIEYRKVEKGSGVQLYDPISEAPMSTEFAISRFLAMEVARRHHISKWLDDGHLGWVLFMDCDVMVRHSLGQLFRTVELHPDKALFCVHHKHEPPVGLKMDAQAQVRYARKNWSSVMLFNLDHPANWTLTVELINKVPGRDLHRFCWLDDKYIGELDVKWNWLVGYSDPIVNPSIVHFTEGGPWFADYCDVPYAEEWRNNLLYG